MRGAQWDETLSGTSRVKRVYPTAHYDSIVFYSGSGATWLHNLAKDLRLQLLEDSIAGIKADNTLLIIGARARQLHCFACGSSLSLLNDRS